VLYREDAGMNSGRQAGVAPRRIANCLHEPSIIGGSPLGALDEMATPARETLRFSPFEVDLRTKELRRDGQTVKLPPHALQLLELLAGHPGQLVTREEIQQTIWGRDTFIDFEHSINVSGRFGMSWAMMRIGQGSSRPFPAVGIGSSRS